MRGIATVLGLSCLVLATPSEAEIADLITGKASEIISLIVQHQGQLHQQVTGRIVAIQPQLDDLQNRQRWEIEARLISPDFSVDEIGLLNRWEVRTDPFVASPKPVEWNRTGLAGTRVRKARREGGPFASYTGWGMSFDARTGKTLEGAVLDAKVDEAAGTLSITVSDADTAYPEVSVTLGGRPPPDDVEVYFEVDTSPEFNSRNMWRHPTLLPSHTFLDSSTAYVDFTTTHGLTFHLFSTPMRDYTSSSRVRFPFRVVAMANGLGSGPADFGTFARTAQLLLHGLPPERRLVEAFRYGRQTLVWGGNTMQFEPVDVFSAGIAGCGAINDMIGAILEKGGLRYRLVGGFNPLYRVWFPGGGHSAIEVHDGQRWTFVDSFLDFLNPGVSAASFTKTSEGLPTLTPMPDLSANFRAALKMPHDRSAIQLGELFKYRIYGDAANRDGMAYMMQLRMGAERRVGDLTESTYGLHWPLRPEAPPLDFERDVPETTTIHVRARYVRSHCKVTPYHLGERCTDSEARLSPWTTTSFEIRPRDLLRNKPQP